MESEIELQTESEIRTETSVNEDVPAEPDQVELAERNRSYSTGQATKSHVLRERHKAQTTKKLVEAMRNALPQYTLEQIREFRLPLHEALTINLEEKGFISTAAYINQLVEFQEEMVKDAPPGSTVAMRPKLKNSKEEIVLLSEKLKLAEIYHNNGQVESECDEFLRVGIHFAFSHSDWWWLGEQILIQGIKVSSEYPSLGGKYEALTRYAYARFLYENGKEFEKAEEQLQLITDICQGKVWTSEPYFPEVRGTLYMQTNRALAECMLKDVRKLMRVNPKETIRLAVKTRHIAAHGCHFNGECQALILKGLCEMMISNTKAAVNSLLNAYNIQKKFGSVEGICEVRIHLARAFLLDNCTNASLKILMELKSDAEENNLPYYLGLAYKNLGDYYLSCAVPSFANPLLKEALRIFKECCVPAEEIANVRNLEAISAGLMLFPKYIELINNSEQNTPEGFDNVMKIVDWKDRRVEFWDEHEDLRQTLPLDKIVAISVRKVFASTELMLNEKFKSVSETRALKRSKQRLIGFTYNMEEGDDDDDDDDDDDEVHHKVRKRRIIIAGDSKSKEQMKEIFAQSHAFQSHPDLAPVPPDL